MNVKPIPIEDMDLSVRSYNCLKRAKIDTLQDLSKLTADDLKYVRNLGVRNVMGLADTFSAEDRVQVKFSDFHNIVKKAALSELLTNGINTNVPHEYMEAMITGKVRKDDTQNG